MNVLLALSICLLVEGALSTREVESITFDPIAQRKPGDDIIHSELTLHETALFICRFRSMSSVPKAVWTKDGSPLPDDPKFRISEKTGEKSLFTKEENPLLSLFKFKELYTRLIITNLQVEDAGTYTCDHSNSPSSGFAGRIFRLKVNEPELSVKHGVLYRPAFITCSGMVYPTSKITWLKNGSPLPKDSRFKISTRFNKGVFSQSNPAEFTYEEAGVELKPAESILMIINAQFKDAGNYSCMIQDSALDHQYGLYFQLIIKEPELESLTVKTQEGPRFFCEVVAENPSFITWLKDGEPLSESSRMSISTVVNVGEDNNPTYSASLKNLGFDVFRTFSKLAINNARLEDSGMYTCLDENPVNPYFEKDYKLSINKTDAIIESAIGRPAFFLCQFTLQFDPQVVWLKDGTPLPEERRFVVTGESEPITYPPSVMQSPLSRLLSTVKYSSLLQIFDTRIEDSGRYTCYIANVSKGKRELNYNLVVQDI